jgi:hypothetical protein
MALITVRTYIGNSDRWIFRASLRALSQTPNSAWLHYPISPLPNFLTVRFLCTIVHPTCASFLQRGLTHITFSL